MSEEKDFIEFLRKSREQIGEEEPVLLTEDGRVVDGKHRLAAYPGWRKKVVDLTPKQASIKRIHRTLKARVTRKERKAQILELALHLEDEGIKKEDMLDALAKEIPFHKEYLRKLLPKKYKPERLAPRKPKFQPEAEVAVEVSKPEAKPSPVAKPKPKPLVCPSCRVELSAVLCPKCWTEIDVKEMRRTWEKSQS